MKIFTTLSLLLVALAACRSAGDAPARAKLPLSSGPSGLEQVTILSKGLE